ncbi:hypothetical protein HY492_02795 [Candidatus Woesearchaeota archaeon]|nr:hypothetical protein [Candidatus Woesearchaeota archaeon]
MVNFTYQNTEKYKLGAGLARRVLAHPEFVDIWAPMALWASSVDEQRGFLETLAAGASDELLERAVAYAEGPQFDMQTLEGKAQYAACLKQHFSKLIGASNVESA